MFANKGNFTTNGGKGGYNPEHERPNSSTGSKCNGGKDGITHPGEMLDWFQKLTGGQVKEFEDNNDPSVSQLNS